MIVVKLAGGLGNQMFQYAAGRYLSKKHKVPLKLDLSFLLDRTPKDNFVYRDYDLNIFNVQENFAQADEIINFGKYRRIGRALYTAKQIINSKIPVYVRENPYHFDLSFFRIPANAYIEGYWQSEKYFKEIELVIRKEFTFLNDLDEHGKEMAERIASVNAVCLNVRRGDYVLIPSVNQHHGVCDVDYFMRAVKVITGKIDNPYFFIFSDDLEWCQANLRFDYPFIVVGHKYAGKKFGQKLNLMTRCKHFIISNSSFGWWAAWLNPNPGKVVVAPMCWFRNTRVNTTELLPSEWIRI